MRRGWDESVLAQRLGEMGNAMFAVAGTDRLEKLGEEKQKLLLKIVEKLEGMGVGEGEDEEAVMESVGFARPWSGSDIAESAADHTDLSRRRCRELARV
eukprot:1630202-Rhodomonas_salina.1